MTKNYKFFHYITVAVSVSLLIISIWYGANDLEKKMASIRLQCAVESLVVNLKKAKGNAKKEHLVTIYSPYFSQLSSKVQDHPGYWKSIYKVYHYMGGAALFQGRPEETITFLKESLQYHPYYPNAYDMLSKVRLLLGQGECATVCEDVYKDIMMAKRPSDSMLRLCRECGR